MSKKEKEEFQYIDKPNIGLKRSAYIRKAVKLDNKDDQFSAKSFYKVRKSSTKSDVVDSFRRIGMCLNKISFSTLPKANISKVCFVTICNLDETNESYGVGPLNDAYLFAFIHYKLGYKVVFLYNPDKSRFVKSLKFFTAHTTSCLALYYSGPDSYSKISQINHGILFNYNEYITDDEISILVGQYGDAALRVFVFQDGICGGTIVNIKTARSASKGNCPDIVTFTVSKNDLTPKEKRLSHGIYTYYFCKLIRQFSESSVRRMAELLNMSMKRFGVSVTPTVSGDELLERSMIQGASTVFGASATPA